MRFKDHLRCYEIFKKIIGDSSRNKFNAVIKSAILQVTNHHFGLSYVDIVEFFNSKEFKEYIETYSDFDDLDLIYLIKYFRKLYKYREMKSSAESILRELLNTIKISLLDDPQIRNIIISNDFRIIKK